MMKGDLLLALERASLDVLETMFFATASPTTMQWAGPLTDSVACSLACTGAVQGSFLLSISRVALQELSESFYGEEEESSATADMDLALELTNMIAGSALSSYLPAQSCALSSPSLYSPADFENMRKSVKAGPITAGVDLDLKGGTLSLLLVAREVA